MIDLRPFRKSLINNNIHIKKVCDWCETPITYEKFGDFDFVEYKNQIMNIKQDSVCTDCYSLLKRRTSFVIEKSFNQMIVKFHFSYEMENDYIVIRITFKSYYNVYLYIDKIDNFIDICNKVNHLMESDYELEIKKIMSLNDFRTFILNKCKNIFRCTPINNAFIYGI